VVLYGKFCWHITERKLRPSAKQKVCDLDIYVPHLSAVINGEATMMKETTAAVSYEVECTQVRRVTPEPQEQQKKNGN